MGSVGRGKKRRRQAEADGREQGEQAREEEACDEYCGNSDAEKALGSKDSGRTLLGKRLHKKSGSATTTTVVPLVRPPPTSPPTSHAYKLIQLVRVNSTKKKNMKSYVDGWNVLLPTKGALWLAAAKLPDKRRSSCKLYPLGAVFPSAEMASRAADRALIALSGRLASSSLLNWPLDEYPKATCHQRFGSCLARYLLEIVQEGRRAMKAARDAVMGRVRTQEEDRVLKRHKQIMEREAAELLKKNPLYSFIQRQCGTCPPCLSPDGDQQCVRLCELGFDEDGYRSQDHALLDAEGVEMRAYHEAIKVAGSRGDAALRARLVIEAAGVAESSSPGEQGRSSGSSLENTPRNSLRWLVDPTGMRGLDTDTTHPVPSAEKIFQEVKEVKADVVAATKEHAWEFPMLRPFPRAWASRGGEDASDVGDGSEGITMDNSVVCRWCGEKRHGPKGQNKSQKQCPVLQAALAVVVPATCKACGGTPGASCSVCLRGSAGLPPDVLGLSAPLRGEPGCADWASRLSPAMLDLVLSIRRLANVAISDFCAEHLEAQLTPDDLLTLANLASEAIDEAVHGALIGGSSRRSDE